MGSARGRSGRWSRCFAGVGEEIGEDLAELGGEAVDAEVGWDVVRDGDAGGGEARLHEEEMDSSISRMLMRTGDLDSR